MLKRTNECIKKFKKKGQSTVEYIILVAAVLAALIIFMGSPNGIFGGALNTTLNEGTDGMQEMSNRLRNSRP